MADLPHLLLGGVASLVHLGLLASAPLALWLVETTGRVLAGHTAQPVTLFYARIGRGFAPGSERPANVQLAAFGLTLAASLLVPSFATGMLQGSLDDLPLVALLLTGARCAQHAAEGDPADFGRGLGLAVFLPPVLLLAGFGLALLAGGPGLDPAIAAVPSVSPIPLTLLAFGLGLAAVADAGHAARTGLALLTGCLRLLTWLDLIATFLPPWSVVASSSGPAGWLASLLLWPVKAGVLAIGLGVAHALLASSRQAWRASALRAASLLALLACVFVLIGQTFE